MIPILLWLLVAGVPDWLDFEVVTIFAIAVGGVALMWADWRRDKRLDTLAIDLVDRVARLEATCVDNIQVEQRIAALEVKAERDERLDERIADYAERIAVVETQLEEHTNGHE